MEGQEYNIVSQKSQFTTSLCNHGNAIGRCDTCMKEAIVEFRKQATKHFSDGKPGVEQIPSDVLLEVGMIYAFGEKKYGRDNWKNGTDWHEFQGSLLRHYYKWASGQDIDEESGLNHLSHVIWNAIALRYYQMHERGKDDR